MVHPHVIVATCVPFVSTDMQYSEETLCLIHVSFDATQENTGTSLTPVVWQTRAFFSFAPSDKQEGDTKPNCPDIPSSSRKRVLRSLDLT